MKVLVLYRDSIQNGSSRVRALQYTSIWENAGAKVKILKRESNSNPFKLVFFYFFLIFLSTYFDVIFIQKPNLPPILFKIFKILRIKIIIDVDDAVWEPTGKPNDRESLETAERIGRYFFYAVKNCNLLVVGSDYLKNQVENKISGINIIVIPPSVDSSVKVKDCLNIQKPTVGWIGSKGNLGDLDFVAESLKELVLEGKIDFLIISEIMPDSYKPWAKFIPWSLENELDSIRKIDIGIMPLNNTLRNKGRCGYKAIQYMNIGIPVIATNIGVSKEIINHKVNGFLVDPDVDWTNEFLNILNETEHLKSMGIQAKSYVQEKFDLSKNAMKIFSNFLSQ